MIRHQPTGVPTPVAGVSRAGFRALLSNAGARVGLNGENMRPSLAQSSVEHDRMRIILSLLNGSLRVLRCRLLGGSARSRKF